MESLDMRVLLAGQVHDDMLKVMEEAKKNFLEVRGFAKYQWSNLFRWWEFNRVISTWKQAWTYDDLDLRVISNTCSPEIMVEPVNDMNDLLVNYKSDIVGVLALAYGKEVAIDFFNIYSFGGHI